jgi:hypothetical protein
VASAGTPGQPGSNHRAQPEVAAAWLAGGLSAGERVMSFEDGTAEAGSTNFRARSSTVA